MNHQLISLYNGPTKPLDFQEPYLRRILEFIGFSDIDVVRLEGVAVGATGVEKAMTSATAWFFHHFIPLSTIIDDGKSLFTTDLEMLKT